MNWAKRFFFFYIWRYQVYIQYGIYNTRKYIQYIPCHCCMETGEGEDWEKGDGREIGKEKGEWGEQEDMIWKREDEAEKYYRRKMT